MGNQRGAEQLSDVGRATAFSRRSTGEISKAQSARRGWLQVVGISFALIVAGSVVSGSGSTIAAVSQVSAAASSDAPGMLRVEWPVESEQARAHRLTWWIEGQRNSTEVTAITSVPFPAPAARSLTLTGLSAGQYRVLVEETTDGSTGTTWTVVGETTPITVAASPSSSCPLTYLDQITNISLPVVMCVDLVEPLGVTGLSTMVEWVSVGTGGSMFTDSGTNLLIAVDFPEYRRPRSDLNWSPENPFGTQPWYNARFGVQEYTGKAISGWWVQPGFGDLDTGETFDRSTDLLIAQPPNSGQNPPTFRVELSAQGALLEGEFLKRTLEGDVVPVDGDSYFLGGDIASPCVEVFRRVDQEWRWNISLCTWGGTKNGPQSGGFSNYGTGGAPGEWKMRLGDGEYRLRFNDRTSYDFSSGVLEANVRFAAHWWKSAESIAENLEQAQSLVITSGTTDFTGLDAVMRDAKQMQVKVTEVPAGYRSGGRIVVRDNFDNWFSGAMEFDEETGSYLAQVTGLVEDRDYNIFLSFEGTAGFRWWLVGGGDLDRAASAVPEKLVEETWQPRPYVLTLHKADGSPYGAGEACVAMVPAGGEEPVASACTTGDLAPGAVTLQRVVNGSYEVLAWTQNTSGQIQGTPMRVGLVNVDHQTQELSIGLPDHAVGIGNVAGLNSGASLPGGYRSVAAVVIP